MRESSAINDHSAAHRLCQIQSNNMNHINTIKPLFLLSSILFFCVNVGGQSNKDAVDPWYFPPKITSGWRELKPQISYRIKPLFVPRYTSQLKSSRLKKIEWAEAQLIVGNAMEKTKGYSPYLVRGLMINDGNGAFRIWKKNNAIWVAYTSLGEFTSWKKQPIVVILHENPTEVYTDAVTTL